MFHGFSEIDKQIYETRNGFNLVWLYWTHHLMIHSNNPGQLGTRIIYSGGQIMKGDLKLVINYCHYC